MKTHILQKFDNSKDLGKWYDNKYTEMGDGWATPGDDVMSHLNFFNLLKWPYRPKLLDIGCGAGHFIEIAERYADCTGIELSEIVLEYAKKRSPESELYIADIETYTPEHKFAFAVSIGSIEHVVDIDRAMKNIYENVLLEGGLFYIYVPNERWQHYDQPHEQTHTDEEWIEIFTKPGFKLLKTQRVNDNTRFLLIK